MSEYITRPVMRPPAVLALVVFLPLALYAKTIDFDFTYLDDDKLVIERAAVLVEPGSAARAFSEDYFPSSVRDHSYYRPLAGASYALDARAAPADPASFHATNVLLHALASGLLLLVLRKLGFAAIPAGFAALWFALHPALTSAVVWIPGRPDLLLGVTSLSLLWFWLHARKRSTFASAAGHALLWLLALFTKESAVVLPLVCAALPWLAEKQPLKKAVPAPIWLAWLAALAVYVFARVRVVSDDLGLQGVSLAGFLDKGGAARPPRRPRSASPHHLLSPNRPNKSRSLCSAARREHALSRPRSTFVPTHQSTCPESDRPPQSCSEQITIGA